MKISIAGVWPCVKVRHASSHCPRKVLYRWCDFLEWDGDGGMVVSIGKTGAEVGIHEIPVKTRTHAVKIRGWKRGKAKRTASKIWETLQWSQVTLARLKSE
jgi:hypothetical protein